APTDATALRAESPRGGGLRRFLRGVPATWTSRSPAPSRRTCHPPLSPSIFSLFSNRIHIDRAGDGATGQACPRSVTVDRTLRAGKSRRSARQCGEAGDRLGLLLDHQRVVELVEKPAQGDAQGQFDDLRLAKMAPQPIEQGLADAAGVIGGGDR